MDMEDHQIHHNQYGITDLRHLINGGGGGGGGRGGAPTATASAATSHLINILPSIPTPTQPPQIPSLSPPPPPPSFETMMMMGRPISAEMIVPLGLHHHHQPHQQHHQYHHDHHHHGLGLIRSDNTASTANTVAAATSSLSGGGLEAETGGCLGGDGGTGRWPRQETLTLLEIRSRLDSKFKEANQKGPLWDEVSRIMSEEHGYQRSGKKCREKFENLYKYYKKTKEGKAGRQDGKHYRFFRQLEALYGETGNSNNNNNSQVISSSVQDYTMANNLRFHNLGNANAMPSNAHLSQLEGYNNISSQPHNKHCDSLSLSNNSSEFESSSSDDNNSSEKTRRNRARGSGSRGWKAKIKDFIDSQMRKLMEKQEAWLEKLMKTLEQKEKERGLREEEWRRQETARIDREHKFWAKERAWIEARDTALMEALKNLTGKEEVLINYKGINNISSPPEIGLNPNNVDDQDGSEIHENINVNVANQGDINHQNNWPESEIMRLIQLRTSMDSRFEQGGFSEEVLWEDIAAKMACLGYDRSSSMCREKWETINVDYAKKSKEMSNSKKRKEDSRECGYGNFQNTNNNESSTSLYNHGGGYNNNCDQMNDGTTSSSPNSNANVGNSSTSHHVVNNHDSCFPFLMGEGSENLWENYGLKINKGGQN